MVRRTLALLLMAMGLFGLGCPKDAPTEEGLTGLHLTIQYESGLSLDSLHFTLFDGADELGQGYRRSIFLPVPGSCSLILR